MTGLNTSPENTVQKTRAEIEAMPLMRAPENERVMTTFADVLLGKEFVRVMPSDPLSPYPTVAILRLAPSSLPLPVGGGAVALYELRATNVEVTDAVPNYNGGPCPQCGSKATCKALSSTFIDSFRCMDCHHDWKGSAVAALLAEAKETPAPQAASKPRPP